MYMYAFILLLRIKSDLCSRFNSREGEQLSFVIHSIKNEKRTVNVPCLVLDPFFTVIRLNADTNLYTEVRVQINYRTTTSDAEAALRQTKKDCYILSCVQEA